MRAFAPGRVNLIGEHTDYNGGLALPFAIAAGVTVDVTPTAGDSIHVIARDLGEEDSFAVAAPARAAGWRAYPRGVVAELIAAGHPPGAATIELRSTIAAGSGLSSSAALCVALALALLDGATRRGGRAGAGTTATGAPAHSIERATVTAARSAGGFEVGDGVALARLCSRVENDWVGAPTGLLDQLASIYGQAGSALRIDFSDLSVAPVPLDLGDWTLAVLHSGASHTLADGAGYRQRRSECAAACRRLGVAALSRAERAAAAALPEPLRSRALHVLDENVRVEATIEALRAGDLATVGTLLDAAHASLRDLYDSSTPEVERAVAALRAAGASGARMVGGGFGGHVLGLFAPDISPPPGAVTVTPAAGARLLSD